MTDKEVMQSAMNEHCPACGYYCLGNGGVYCIDKPTTVETTRAFLAQPEQYDQTELELCKKCGWKAVWPDGCLVCEKQEAQPVAWKNGYKAGYAQAQETDLAMPRKEWVGLTHEEYEAMAEQCVTNCYFDTLEYAKSIEAKLKEKNT